ALSGGRGKGKECECYEIVPFRGFPGSVHPIARRTLIAYDSNHSIIAAGHVMTRKSWLIGGGIVIGLGIAAAIAAPPLLEHRAREATDAFFAGLSRSEGVTATRGATPLDIWGRTRRIEGLSVRTEKGPTPFTVKADTPTVER